MTQVSQGDKDALASLFRRYGRVVRVVAYRVLRDQSEAEDLQQEVFILIYRLCQTFDRSMGSVRFWILQMTFRRAISRRRYLNSRQFYTHLDLDHIAELPDPQSEVPTLDDSIDGGLENGHMHKVFAALSEDQRQTLHLFFIEGYTLDEIAIKLGQSRGNVKHHYFRGLEKLRKALFGNKLPGERSL